MRLFPFWAFWCRYMCLTCFGIEGYLLFKSWWSVSQTSVLHLFNFAYPPASKTVWFYLFYLPFLVLLVCSCICHIFSTSISSLLHSEFENPDFYMEWTTKWEKLRRVWIFGFFLYFYIPNSYWFPCCPLAPPPARIFGMMWWCFWSWGGGFPLQSLLLLAGM